MVDWYESRHLLNHGDVCILYDGSRVRLDYRVPGDGTDWYAVDINEDGEESYEDNRIHPGDIVEVK